MVVGGNVVLNSANVRLKPLKAKRKIALTGTPIPNKPIELFNILKYLSPYGWPNKIDFAKRYCNAQMVQGRWDDSGSSNLEELQTKLRSSIMIRRLKKDILRDLPPKVRQIIEIEGDSRVSRLLEEQEGLFGGNVEGLSDAEFRLAVKRIKGGNRGDATIRRELGIAKIPYMLEFLENALMNSEKVIVFAHHKDVISKLKEKFKDICVVIDGSTAIGDREKAVEGFQNGDKRLFIGNMIAAGTAITLTASSHIIFFEVDWTPGVLDQCESRAHRIGQENSLLIQYLLFAKSLDSSMLKRVIFKQETIEEAVNIGVDKDLEELLN